MTLRSAAEIDAHGKEPADTTEAAAQRQASDAWPLTLADIIKQTLVRRLRETAGNRRRTASLLGISRSTLYRMLARYEIGHVGRAEASRKPRTDRSVPPRSTA